jgi:Flp pilus assembly protein TadB
VPTRKQRRRRAKERRHEYEYVYVDEEGREVEVDEPEQQASKRRNGRSVAQTRSGRRIDPPSWRRVGRRGLIFAPIMFAVIMLLGGSPSVAAAVAQTIFLMLVFLPFSYVMDSFLYRTYTRRAQQKSKN